MSAPCTDPAAERIEFRPPVQGCDAFVLRTTREGGSAWTMTRCGTQLTGSAQHICSHPALYPLSRGTALVAARVDCSLAICLPAHGGERTLLSGARRGSVGAETKVGSPADAGSASAARCSSNSLFPHNSIQVAATSGRCGAHLLRFLPRTSMATLG